jgi:hypothetical protein
VQEARAGQYEHELLAPEPDGEVGLANRPRQHRGDLLQDRVARLVAVAVVDRLEVVEVGDHEGDARAVAGRARELVLEPHGQLATVREPRERVGVRLAGQPRDVPDHLRERPREPARERRGENQRQRGTEEDEAAVRLRQRVDRGDGLDGDERHSRGAQWRRLRREPAPAEVGAPPADAELLPLVPTGEHAPVADEQERAVLRQRRRLAEQREHVLTQGERDRHRGERADTVRDRGRGGDSRRRRQRPDRAAAVVDARLPVGGDALERGHVVGDDGALERQRGRELRRADAEVRAQGVE